MHASKPIQILRTLKPGEFKRFRAFVYSPFFNEDEALTRLFDLLSRHYPKFTAPSLTMEQVYRKLFPKKKYEEQAMRYLLSDLTKLLEEFLAFRSYDRQEVFKKVQVIKAYQQRDLDKYFNQLLNQLQKQQEKTPHRDAPFYYHQYLIEDAFYQYTSIKRNRAIDTSLKNAEHNLDLFYLTQKLRYSCEIINRRNVVATQTDPMLLDEIMGFLGKQPHEEVAAIAIYKQILLTLQEPEEEAHYHKLKKLLARHAKQFPQRELSEMYTFALNYCIKQLNSGKPGYLRELFDLYRYAIEHGYIFEGKYLSHIDYKNFVTVGLRLEEFDYVEAFVHRFKRKISPGFRENAFNFNLTNLYYARGDYDKALELLHQVTFTDVYYHLDAKALLMKIYYEVNEVDALFSLLDSFRNYLHRNKQVSKYQRRAYLNLIKFFNKLFQLKNKQTAYRGTGKKLFEKLKKVLNETSPVANMKWLEQKVGELEKGSRVT